MSSYRSEILQFPNRVMYAELEAYRINIWANVFPMICCYDLCIHIPQSAHHETDSNSRIELDLFPIIDFGNWNRFPSLIHTHNNCIIFLLWLHGPFQASAMAQAPAPPEMNLIEALVEGGRAAIQWSKGWTKGRILGRPSFQSSTDL